MHSNILTTLEASEGVLGDCLYNFVHCAAISWVELYLHFQYIA